MIPERRFFHISPEWCGQERLVQLFRLNGYPSACHEDGRLAEDICFSHAAGVAPLQGWPGAHLVTGLYRNLPHWRPPLEAWRLFAWLDRQFPQAHFILTLRNPETWLLDRLTRDGGAAARMHARETGIAQERIADHWLAQWHAHIAAVEAHFGDDPRLIRVDIDRQTPQALCSRLDAILPMRRHPQGRVWVPEPDRALEDQLLSILDRGPVPIRTMPGAEAWLDDVAGFCLRGVEAGGQGVGAVSSVYCDWAGDAGVRGREGGPQPIAVWPAGDLPRRAVSAPDSPFKLVRAEGVINDILRLGRSDPVRIDMEDSRRIGLGEDPPAPPILCHNRREGARNVVLWPLPGQHDIGMPGFDAHVAPDRIPFDQKIDRVVWRGMISGARRSVVEPGEGAHRVFQRLAEAADPTARAAAWRDLCEVPRLDFVRRFHDHPDFDLGVVLAWRFRQFADQPLLQPYLSPRKGQDFLRRFRYRLCLSGYDHGSNFISAIDSQSVLLKEEDGWEVFYSGRFTPWKHYIPIQRYCTDVEEKLQWARSNELKCKEMSARARDEVARLSDPGLRRRLLGRILDGLAALR